MAEVAGVAGPAMKLADGARVGVVGAGPAGSLFAHFALTMARRAGRRLDVTLFEPRDYGVSGAGGCNMCGGIVSESLLQAMAADGVPLPPSVVQRSLDAYVLHMDVGSVRIATPLGERRIATVYRGGGPRDAHGPGFHSLDGSLLDLAVASGASLVRSRVTGFALRDGRPALATAKEDHGTFDLVAVATGVNSPALKLFEDAGVGYTAPATEKTFIGEFHLGRETVSRYLGSAMHVFLLDLPGLDFAAIIPKSSYATVCLIGEGIEDGLVERFLDSREVREVMPPHWSSPSAYCRCRPRLNVGGPREPFADRLVFLGDTGVTRLYKDGIGAAYRTSKCAAVTAVFQGVGAEHFRRHFGPLCRSIAADNRLGRVVFAFTRQIQHRRFARTALWRTVSREQVPGGGRRRMSEVLWDTFTGSAPYKTVFTRAMNPAFLGRFAADMAPRPSSGRGSRRPRMATGTTGLVGKRYRDGEVIFHQGDRGDSLYVIMGGQVELLRREGDREFCLATLGSGDVLGETVLLGQDVRAATARADGDVTVFTLEKESLLARLHEDPSLAFRIIEKLAGRVRDLEDRLVRGATLPVR